MYSEKKIKTIIWIIAILFIGYCLYTWIYPILQDKKIVKKGEIEIKNESEPYYPSEGYYFGESEEAQIEYPQTFINDPNELLADTRIMSEINHFMIAQALGEFLTDNGYPDVGVVNLDEQSIRQEGSTTIFTVVLPDEQLVEVRSYNLTESFKFTLLQNNRAIA